MESHKTRFFSHVLLLFLFRAQLWSASAYGDDLGNLIEDSTKKLKQLCGAGSSYACTHAEPTGANKIPLKPPPLPNYPTTLIKNEAGRAFEISVLPEGKLDEVFKFVKNSKVGGWDNNNFCAQRAHLVGAYLKSDMNIESAKLISLPSRLSLGLEPQLANGQRPLWDFHMATMVAVERNGKIEQWVLDPATFNYPVPREEWEKLQKNLAGSHVLDRFATGKGDLYNDDYPRDYVGSRSPGAAWQAIQENLGKRF